MVETVEKMQIRDLPRALDGKSTQEKVAFFFLQQVYPRYEMEEAWNSKHAAT